MVNKAVPYPDAYVLLGQLFERQGKLGDALSVYRRGSQNRNLSARDRYMIDMRRQRLLK